MLNANSSDDPEISTGNSPVPLPEGSILDDDSPDENAAVRERKLTVLYKPPQVSVAEINVVMESWTKGDSIMRIMRRLQAPRTVAKKQPLVYVDIYSILYILAAERKIAQRTSNQEELTLNDFAAFFNIWKAGGSLRECCRGITERPTTACINFAKLVHRSLGDRHRAERKLQVVGDATTQNREQVLYDHVLKLAVRRKVDNRDALVIFLSDIPINLLNQLRKLGDGLKFDPEIRTGSDVLDRLANKQPPSNPHPLAMREVLAGREGSEEDIDLRILDPTGDVSKAGEERVSQKQAEREQRKRLHYGQPALEPKFPSASATDPDDPGDLEENLAGNFTLENLADDDPLDPDPPEDKGV